MRPSVPARRGWRVALSQMKTPGVYIAEKNAFPPSVVEVATAVPAFIGYTDLARNGGNSPSAAQV